MGRFKKFFGRNKSEDVVEKQDIPESEELLESEEMQEDQEAPANGSAVPLDVSMIQRVGFQDAVNLLTDAYEVDYWHDVEIDEEDLPETEGELLLACRYTSGEKGFAYRVGTFDDSAAAWKEIHYVDPNEADVEVDETFVERRLQQIQDQLPNIPDFSLIKRAYINGFGEGSRQMKRKIQGSKWHAVANVQKELRDMGEEVLAAVDDGGKICFEVVSQDVFTMEIIDSKYVAWANIEPFNSIMDQV